MKPLSPGFRYMAAGAFFFALMSLLVRLAGARLPTMEVVLARSLVTLLLSLWGLRHLGVPVGGERRNLLLLRGGLGFIALSSFYYGVIHLPLADATVIQYTNPVFTAVLAAIFLSERMRSAEGLLVLASLGGVVLMARPTFLFGGPASALPPGPVAIALLGAVFSAAAYTVVRALGRTEHPLVVVFWFSAVSTLCALPLAVRGFLMPRGWEWLLLLAVGVTTQLGQVFLTMGLREERAGRAMAVAYLQIVFAAVLGVAFLAEVPDRWTLLGASVILLSTWALHRLRGRVEPSSA